MAVNCIATGAPVGRKGARFSGTQALYFLFSRNHQGWRFAHLAGEEEGTDEASEPKCFREGSLSAMDLAFFAVQKFTV